MEIHRVGVSAPLSETPTESVAPKETPKTQASVPQPFQNDTIVSAEDHWSSDPPDHMSCDPPDQMSYDPPDNWSYFNPEGPSHPPESPSHRWSRGDAIVSSYSPALDLGISSANYSTPPLATQAEESKVEGRNTHRVRPDEDDVLSGVHEAWKQSGDSILKNMR